MHIDFNNLDTSSYIIHDEIKAFIYKPYFMISMAKNIRTLTIDNCTDGIRTLHSLFGENRAVRKIRIENFNSSILECTRYAFSNCEQLEEVNIEAIDTRNVDDMHEMFVSCKSLKTLNLAKMNTQNVTDMAGMFQNCTSLERLDLSNFDTRSVRYTHLMFKNCNSLKYLDLSSFNLCNIVGFKQVEQMFNGCDSLEKIILPKDARTREMLLEALDCSLESTTYGCLDIE